MASIIAKGTVRRALADVGSTPAIARGPTYVRALPALSARLAAFLPSHEVAAATQRIRRLVESAESPER